MSQDKGLTWRWKQWIDVSRSRFVIENSIFMLERLSDCGGSSSSSAWPRRAR
jgi:hypothetical protein